MDKVFNQSNHFINGLSHVCECNNACVWTQFPLECPHSAGLQRMNDPRPPV